MSAVFENSQRDGDGVLYDPPMTSKRGNFHGRYLTPKVPPRGALRTNFRLLDCLLTVAPHTDADYMTAARIGEFAVVDVVTFEKAWFDMPPECTPEMVTVMVESCFMSKAYRVGNKLWFV